MTPLSPIAAERESEVDLLTCYCVRSPFYTVGICIAVGKMPISESEESSSSGEDNDSAVESSSDEDDDDSDDDDDDDSDQDSNNGGRGELFDSLGIDS